MSNGFNPEAFKRDLEETLEKGREAFKGLYKDELNQLAGLSRAEIDAITPDTTDLETYDQLITVVKEASRVNLAQAELKSNIEQLGATAVTIAKKVPSLAALFV